MMQQQLVQELSPVDFLFTQSVNNTTVSTSPGIDFSKFNRGVWYVEVTGSVAGGAVISIQPQSAQNSNFNVFHNMTNFAITNMGTNNTVTQIEVRGDQVTSQNPTTKDRYVRLNITGATQAATVCVIGVGGDTKQGPANQAGYLNTTVVSTVVCTT